MIKVGILGANGRMGRVLIEAAHAHNKTALGFASVRANSSFIGMDAGELAGIARQHISVSEISSDTIEHADVLIDFTLPEALGQNLRLAVDAQKPIVIGTTGLNKDQLNMIDEAAKYIPVVFAANYSVGINLMLNLVKQAATVMGNDADIEIIEGHHRFKKDSPSGTAMAIGHSIADSLGRDLDKCAIYGREGVSDERRRETIGFATVRAGDIVGDHTALFATLGERLEITHKASSRLTFANGALTASCWIKEQAKGLYSMQDVLGLV
ncbi:4-hydroxy-tetrahydrodipicolinate reductase [Agaribacter marinus]|uniref:4-hydroxy-tetrahydrodipicolinate reductase n=1 Tax=Agaribacter marinus TaxID=1431249 RepID=A0AA37T2P4_9ALTE|nr:4-hydroxy-tetrahydrodipicolinate reductase [Agaribacter marinus]GLR70585.1 4-hydroxy-tetrahydrodipicolinate reductase [Agaribacter marinus]